MKRPDRGRAKDLGRWVAAAEEDIEVAGVLLSQRRPYGASVCFHAQQCAEKYLKAFLVRHGVGFPKTHDIDILLDLAEPVDRELAEVCEDADELTPYAVEVRYWVEAQRVTAADAKRAFELASKVRAAVRERLRDHLADEGPEPSAP
jgi:HEPN domain-containing protein